jgi:hypothetical protein
MRTPIPLGAALLAALPLVARADDPPKIEHQPPPCTVPGQPVSLCAGVSDDGQVSKVRIFFRPEGADYFSSVEMAFGGINYCGTLPAPREGKLKAFEYYIQALDDQFQPERTSTYRVNVQPEGVCGFPPVAKGGPFTFTILATSKKQGKKLPDEFETAGVTFVPATR